MTVRSSFLFLTLTRTDFNRLSAETADSVVSKDSRRRRAADFPNRSTKHVRGTTHARTSRPDEVSGHMEAAIFEGPLKDSSRLQRLAVQRRTAAAHWRTHDEQMLPDEPSAPGAQTLPMRSSSTSKRRSALGGMSLPAPASP